MLYDPDVTIERKTEVIKSKQEEICTLTKELKSHYFQGKYFVDPDKTFIPLLDRVIKFFERDDLACKIQDSEELYLNYKLKYHNAIQLVNTLTTEKEQLVNLIEKLQKTKSNSDGDDDDDYTEINQHINKQTDLTDTPSSQMTQSNNCNDIHDNAQVSPFNPEDFNQGTISLEDYERLKEEYITILNQRKQYENENLHLREIQEQFKDLRKSYEHISDIKERQHEKIISLEQQAKVSQSQLEKFTKDKEDLYQTISALRERINLCESEKSSIKIKNAHHLSKFQFLEKELTKVNKKNQIQNNNIKELLEKLHYETEAKVFLKQQYEERLEEMENRMIIVENEKKRVMKDSMAAFVESTAKKMNNLSLAYNADNDKIEIKFEDEIIGEVGNNKNEEGSNGKSSGDCNREATICRFRQLTCYDKTSSSTQMLQSPNKNVSLRKLFSNNIFSISSKKSYESNSIFEDKENNNRNGLNINSIILNSIGKRNHNGYIVIDKKNEETHESDMKSNERNIANCILNANISKETLTFRTGPTNNDKEKDKDKDKDKEKTKEMEICFNGEMNYEGRKKTMDELDIESFIIEYEKNGKLVIERKKQEKYMKKLKEDEIKAILDNSVDTYYSQGLSATDLSFSNAKLNNKLKSKGKLKDFPDDVIKEKEGKCVSCLIF